MAQYLKLTLQEKVQIKETYTMLHLVMKKLRKQFMLKHLYMQESI